MIKNQERVEERNGRKNTSVKLRSIDAAEKKKRIMKAGCVFVKLPKAEIMFSSFTWIQIKPD